LNAPDAIRILVDGRATGCVPVLDRGLAYGDGLFETLAVTAGEIRLWDAHCDRLERGCAVLGLPAPDRALLRHEAESLLTDSDPWVLRITLTRGVGGRGYAPPLDPRPTRILSRHPWPASPTRSGVRVRLCRHRLSTQPYLAGLKHLNRLDQVLARAEWDDPGIAEGLMRDQAGRVVEGTAANLFLVRGGVLETPRLHRCGVAGVARALTLEIATRLGIPWRERDLRPGDLYRADALFLTNSLQGLVPVARLADHAYDPAAIPPALRRGVRAGALGDGA